MPLDKLTEITTAGNGDVTAATVLVIGAGAGLFAAFCPSWFTVRSAFFHEQSGKDGNVKAIRQGELAGALTTLLQGFAAARLVKSPMPFLGALAVSLIMVVGYEYSLKHPATDDAPDDSMRSAMSYRAA
ncbi:MAG: hypothetical protein ACREMY_00885 [bacterium]